MLSLRFDLKRELKRCNLIDVCKMAEPTTAKKYKASKLKTVSRSGTVPLYIQWHQIHQVVRDGSIVSSNNDMSPCISARFVSSHGTHGTKLFHEMTAYVLQH